MFNKKRTNELEFEVIERTVLDKFNGEESVKLTIRANKPIPPATHGTVALKGKVK
jgi:hypothetical protein